MARPYVVNFPQSPASMTSPETRFTELGVIAPLQNLIEAPVFGAVQNLILDYITPDTIPVTPYPNDQLFPIDASTNWQNTGPGIPVQIFGGSRSIVIMAGAVDLSTVMFTVTGRDQFNNVLSSGPTAGPGPNSGIEFQAVNSNPAYGFNLYFREVDAISWTGIPNANAQVWACIGGYGVTPFISTDTYRIGFTLSVSVHVPPSVRTQVGTSTWGYQVYTTSYPLYTPARGGQWAPLNPDNIPRYLVSGASSTALQKADVIVNVLTEMSYTWNEVFYEAAVPAGLFTQPSSFEFIVSQQGA